jgi:hypothetical protein
MTLSALGIFSAAGAGGVAFASDYDLIETVILTSNVASMTFSGLSTYSSTYKHFQIRGAVRATLAATSESFGLRFNGDSSTAYTQHGLVGTGTSVVSFSASPATQNIANPGQITAANATANSFSGFVLDVLDPYSTTKNTTFRCLLGSTGYNNIALDSGVYLNTAAISSISLLAGNQNLAIGSRFSLYGIKG